MRYVGGGRHLIVLSYGYSLLSIIVVSQYSWQLFGAIVLGDRKIPARHTQRNSTSCRQCSHFIAYVVIQQRLISATSSSISNKTTRGFKEKYYNNAETITYPVIQI